MPRSHRSDKIDVFFESITSWLPRPPVYLEKAVAVSLFKVLLGLSILQEKEISLFKENISNRTLLVATEAEKKGALVRIITFFTRPTNFFTIRYKDTKQIFEALPCADISSPSRIDIDDKAIFKKLLETYNFPYPKGQMCQTYTEAEKAANIIGFPVVVKPSSGSLSKHVSCNIINKEELTKAVDIVQMISGNFIVESHIPGEVYRIIVIDGHLVACAKRETAHVIGDGMHTISELINSKNADSRRRDIDDKNVTLHKIPVTEKTLEILKAKSYDLQTVLEKGVKIYVHDKVVLAAGADIHDVTDEVHPDIKKMFENVAERCGFWLIGFDFICTNISESYTIQPCGILEANSLPFIDMHHFPTTGKARNVAGILVDHYIHNHLVKVGQG
ncbi:hypothetical protein KW782_03985 [Candidatus Parcubacteria bacterium]|nr:hypothetical protein [Candidatus Parcubacteria bacterium]